MLHRRCLPRRILRGLFPAAIACLVWGAASADTVVALDCTPAYARYCENVHVGCAGRSAYRTGSFKLVIAGPGFVFPAIGPPSQWRAAASSSGTVFRRDGAKDWLRLAQDRSGALLFSERIHVAGKTYMAHGRCRHEPRPGPSAR